ncbi:GNAT family N-acetyltransferase [Paenibacillus sp. ISL-20]|uniref:GNAT family N-acetyltransferase n=1 Tax=Paenibacillus sp. ISL-20 TaxID=2819163 RepID=UPI002551DA67|nr:GNAT family N-acetyltransferase [Paenibacillus sp. ISL-20]
MIGHVGLDYRVMNLNGKPIRVLGVIDLCVSQSTRSQGLGSTLLLEIDKFSVGRNIDFILLFADNMTLYLRNGYKPLKNRCKWLKIDDETQLTNGIGYEAMNELMIKEVGKTDWSIGNQLTGNDSTMTIGCRDHRQPVQTGSVNILCKLFVV